MDNKDNNVRQRASKIPKSIAYRDVNELHTLKDWFYNFSSVKDQRHRAIQRVNALLSRGRLPHAVEITSHLTSICISDPTMKSDYPKQRDANVLQLSYSMALIRFVNGLLDPFQQGNYAISLHTLAGNIGLPSFFVELRHMGTHEQLPNLDVLRIACTKALNWLFDNYWCQVEKIEEGHQDLPVSPPIPPEQTMSPSSKNDVELASRILANLKTYKRLRKQRLDVKLDRDDSTRDGMRFWKSIKNIQEITKEERGCRVLLDTLILQNFLIYNHDKLAADKSGKKFKFNSLLFKLYKPLLDEMGATTKEDLLEAMLSHVEAKDSESDSSKLTHENELVQIDEWIKYLVNDLAASSGYTSLQRMVAILEKCTDSTQLKYIPLLENDLRNLPDLSQADSNNPSFSDSNQSTILQKLTKMKNTAKLKRFAPPPPLDPLVLGVSLDSTSSAAKRSVDSEPIAGTKKQKLPPAETHPTCFILEEHQDWHPVPFGVCP